MTLQTSGQITLNNIQTEFGGSNPISFSEYYAGGANVPAGSTGTNGAIPSSGAISLSNFYGTSVNTLTTGGDFYSAGGGKGSAFHTLFTYGFTPGSTVYGNYVDYGGFYSIAYASIGTFIGKARVGGVLRTVSELKYQVLSSEDSSSGFSERKLVIRIAANVSGTAYTPYINGSSFAGSKVGSWDGTNTVFTWLDGTQANTGGTPIPGSDTSTPSSSPFGNSGDVLRTFEMI